MKPLAPPRATPDGETLMKLRCAACGWVGWQDVWRGGRCPRCGGGFGRYA